MTEDQVLDEFRAAGAFPGGHFILSSGLSLIRIDVPSCTADRLPPELAAIPPVKPGSRAAT